MIKHNLSIKKSNCIIRRKLIGQIRRLNKIISKYDNILNNNSDAKDIKGDTIYNEPLDKLHLILYIQTDKINFLSKLSDSLTNEKINANLLIDNLKADNLNLKNINEDLNKLNKKLQKDIDFLRPKPPVLELKVDVSFDIEAIMKLINGSK
jgi:hypothetical protein